MERSQELERNVIEKPLIALLSKYKNQITEILPKQFDSKRVLKLIVGAINRNPKLLSCTPMSVINAVLTAATMGLEIRPGMAYLIPYGKECTLIVDYRGKIDMVLRTGKVFDIDPEVVYSKEKFRLYRDENGYRRVEHEPLLFKVLENGDHAPIAEADRGVPIGAYAVAVIKDGPPKIAWMPAVDIDKIRKKSRAKDDGPWVTDTMEMWKKTVVHRICKTLPQSPELAMAQEADDRLESDVSLDNIIDFAPEDDTGLPLLGPGSARAAEAVADRKIDELEKRTPPLQHHATGPRRAPHDRIAPALRLLGSLGEGRRSPSQPHGHHDRPECG